MARILLLVGLCVAAYAPTLTIPLMQDDYPLIAQSRTYGLPQLWSDATFRLRSTSFWSMHAVWASAGMAPAVYHAVSLLLHMIACVLLYELAINWEPMRQGALWAAAFFAFYERHQEAVMWFSAISELLMFVFGIAAMICWLRAARSAWWHVPGALLFALALLSKESAVIFLPLFLLVRWKLDWGLAPYLGAGALAVASVVESRANSFRFSDGSFSLAAPFWITLAHSTFRILWVWGAVAILFWMARKRSMRPVGLALVWILVALLPYAWLTYSTAIPSRQVYLASAGLAMLVGLAFQHLSEMTDRKL
ncbi:MAG TPA: hypothetical protein VGP79_09235, partial [Bryobacteraceae bacterium]|nr:hypothetical protein [Bryobacteraceae bacterium]